MLTLDISQEEIEAARMEPQKLQLAVKAVQEDGFVILANVVDVHHIAALKEKVLEDVALLLARKDAPYNWNQGNIQQDPPPFAPYLYKDVLLNELVIDVTVAILGPGVKNSFYSGNTAIRSNLRQPIHADTGHLWPAPTPATPAFGLVVNVPLVEMSAENGSTEIWPGSHLDTSVWIHSDTIEVPSEAVEQRRAFAPPLQPAAQPGSILIRDIRLWHAGMPNHTDNPRPMIAMIHWSSWMDAGVGIKLPEESRSFFDHPRLRTVAEFVNEPIDYIKAPQSYSFT